MTRGGFRTVPLWLCAGFFYFLSVFSAGFCLGAIRELLVAPRTGSVNAELIEIPLMIIITWFCALLMVARHHSLDFASAVKAGLFALTLLIAAEITLVPGLRHLPLSDYVASKDNLAGLLYLCSLVFFTFAPVLGLYKSSRSRITGD